MIDKPFIPVFQDLRITSAGPVPKIRDSLLKCVSAPWYHDPEGEQRAGPYLGDDRWPLAIARAPVHDIPEVLLFLWQSESDFHISNIVPRQNGELGIAKYNRILQDFVRDVATPAAKESELFLEVTKELEGIDDWTTADAAAALRKFSGLANKSTGASHPLDQRRWFDFILISHRGGKPMDSGLLGRWLIESEGWFEDIARELANDYDTAVQLLKYADEN